jgi:uncharacterized protein (DUF2235 family)
LARNFVLCADGTCNAFGPSSSNVAKLLQYVELRAPEVQAVCYAQGVGTRRGQHKRVRKFRDSLGASAALCLTDPPNDSWLAPWTWKSWIEAMAYGTGLDVHVGRLYVELAKHCREGDTVYGFGFSRGAFVVRALAGLVWRYGLPAGHDKGEARARFAEAWPLFRQEFPDKDGTNAERAAQFRAQHAQRPCPFEFLGLWDTVKSYGGLEPVMLPHLRHNPSVRVVRHALALDEQRGWFELTTWGWLDSDQEVCAAASRLAPDDAARIAGQNVVEVWFNGCHADVGGGGRNEATSDISLRWMLGEAHAFGLELNDVGREFLTVPAGRETPTVVQSRSLFWKVIERKQRQAIVNAGRWPALVVAPRGASPRHPRDSVRGLTLWHHESATDLSRFGTLPADVRLMKHHTRRCAPTSAPRSG